MSIDAKLFYLKLIDFSTRKITQTEISQRFEFHTSKTFFANSLLSSQSHIIWFKNIFFHSRLMFSPSLHSMAFFFCSNNLLSLPSLHNVLLCLFFFLLSLWYIFADRELHGRYYIISIIGSKYACAFTWLPTFYCETEIKEELIKIEIMFPALLLAFYVFHLL